MRYCEFARIEATYFFMLKMKDGKQSDTTQKTEQAEKLSNLQTATPEDLGLSKEYMEIFK